MVLHWLSDLQKGSPGQFKGNKSEFILEFTEDLKRETELTSGNTSKQLNLKEKHISHKFH